MNEKARVSQAARLLDAGQLVAFPTETVYGLGADATNDAAVAAIYAAKGRPMFNPLISHVADAEAAFELGDFPDAARTLATAFWPGPLTLVVPRAAGCSISLLASAGLPSVSLRVPQHPLALELLHAFGKPVVAPSANMSGRVSPTTAAHVKAGLGNKVAMILDGGPSQVGVESTVVGFVDAVPRLLRPGGLPRESIEQAIGMALAEAGAGPLLSPGQLESHYAPKAGVRLNAVAPQAGETYLGFGAHQSGPYSLSLTGDVVEAAANLFRLLHEIDTTGTTAISVAPIPHHGLGEAINDRLKRAAAPR